MQHLAPDPSLEDFRAAVSLTDEEIDLARAALLVACVEYPELAIETYLDYLNEQAARVRARIEPWDEPLEQVRTLVEVAIRRGGLRGVRMEEGEDYYDPRNSFLNEVIDRHVGIPISLSIVVMGIAERAGIALAGTAMPMHFLVRVLGLKEPLFLDCFNGGQLLTEEDCRRALTLMSQNKVNYHPEVLQAVSNAEILTRLLTNLKLIYFRQSNLAKAVPILDRLLVLNPGAPPLLRERGLVLFRLGRGRLARSDLERYLASSENPPDAPQIREILGRIV